jgi:hypothetical protein
MDWPTVSQIVIRIIGNSRLACQSGLMIRQEGGGPDMSKETWRNEQSRRSEGEVKQKMGKGIGKTNFEIWHWQIGANGGSHKQ